MHFSRHMRLTSCAIVLLALHCTANVNFKIGNNRRQFISRNEQQAINSPHSDATDQAVYPAVGFRPVRPFNLPIDQGIQQQQSDNFNNQNFNDIQQSTAVRPDTLYSVPEPGQYQRTRQFQAPGSQQQLSAIQQQQQQYAIQQQQQQQQQQQLAIQQQQQLDIQQPQSVRQQKPQQKPQQKQQLQQSSRQQQQQQQLQQSSRQQQLQPVVMYQQQLLLPFEQQQSFGNKLQSNQFVFQQNKQLQSGPQQFPNTQSESSRLMAEPEERELQEDNFADIEVNVKNAAEDISGTTASVAPQPQPTIAYFPTNAVNFVKPFQAGLSSPNPATTYLQYKPTVVAPPLAKIVAANPAQLPIAAQYYATNSLLPSTFSVNSFTAYPSSAAQLQAW